MARVAEPDLEHHLLYGEERVLQLGARAAEAQVAQVARGRNARLRAEDVNEARRRQVDARREYGHIERPVNFEMHPFDDGGDPRVHAAVNIKEDAMLERSSI